MNALEKIKKLLYINSDKDKLINEYIREIFKDFDGMSITTEKINDSMITTSKIAESHPLRNPSLTTKEKEEILKVKQKI